MKQYTKGIIDESMSRIEEKNLAIELLEDGFFWLDDTLCKVHSIERNERHYFINYEDRISNNVNIKSIIVSQLKRIHYDH